MRFKRMVAIGLAAASIALSFEFIAPAIAGASTSFDYTCAGVNNDDAGGGKTSKDILEGTVSLLTGSATLPLTVTASTDAPAKLRPGAAPFTANFDFAITLPSDLLKKGHDLLGLSKVTVKNASFGVSVSGAGTGSINGSLASTDVDLTSPSLVINQHLSGTVTPGTGGGIIAYRPGVTQMTIVLGIANPKIDSLTVSCTSSKLIATTAIQLPGAPNVATDIAVTSGPGSSGTLLLDGSRITPDDNKPINRDSLQITDPPAGATAVAAGGGLFVTAPDVTRDYSIGMQVCANGLSPIVPGTSEIEQMSWGQADYNNQSLNAHPLGFKLSFKGAKTAYIPLSFNKALNTPTDPTNNVEVMLFSEFRAPSAATLQAALEQLPTIGAGNISVTGGGANAPYRFTFLNALGASEQPNITVAAGDWTTWLPSDLVTNIAAGLPKPTPTVPGATTVPPLTIEQIDALLPTIGFTEWLNKRGDLLVSGLLEGASGAITELGKIIPKAPVWDYELHHGTATTGGQPLCTPFTVTYHVVSASVLGTQIRRVCVNTKVRVKGFRKLQVRKVCHQEQLKLVPTRKRVTTTKVVIVKGHKRNVRTTKVVTVLVPKWVRI